MPDRLITTGRLGDLLERANAFTEPPQATYSLYVPKDRKWSLDENVECGLLLILNDDPDDFIPDEAKERPWVLVSYLQIIQTVVDVANKVHPNPTQSDLVKALEYFVDNGTFLQE
ncbi:MAG: hypothetical protein GC179_06345 [Anaerolineaceae bacterium]|nr:hypothetical protein [Anaerolineaceae bacterium]